MQRSHLALLVALVGCYDPGSSTVLGDAPPGVPQWGESNITCTSNDDCREDELCSQRICQVRQCNRGPYTSTPPLAPDSGIYFDHDLAVADQAQDAIALLPADRAGVGARTLLEPNAGPIVDLAGGNLIEGPAQELVIAHKGSTVVSIASSQRINQLDVGLVPVAVAAANLDRVGLDEVIALGATSVAICQVEAASCTRRELEAQSRAKDVATGDIDGDGVPEIVVLFESNHIVALHLGGTGTAEGERTVIQVGYTPDRISVGDLDNDGQAEVVAIHKAERDNQGHVHIHNLNPERPIDVATWDVDRPRDVSVGDLDHNGTLEVFVLRDGGKLTILSMGRGSASHPVVADTRLQTSSGIDLIAAVDMDGDSTYVKLISGPEIVQSRPIPTVVAFFPPYWRELSDTPANVYVGDSELSTEGFEDTIGFRIGVQLGVEPSFFDIVSASLTGELARRVGRAYTKMTTKFVGDRVWTQAAPEQFGPAYGTVMLVYNCYHQYTYQMADPLAEVEGADGKKFILLVPIDVNSALLSTMRWNSLARALGDLPTFEAPHRIGDPTTYPTEMVTLAGKPIPEVDKVVPKPPSYTVSEVGFIGFWLALWETSGRRDLKEIEVDLRASVTVAGYKVGGSLGAALGKSHTIELGTEAVFGGFAPTLPDDPATPEDEYQLFQYSFSPIVYLDRYVNSEGVETPYYVYHYMVGL
jgi:hypothetical protein